jgi:hypothetical protein
MFLRLASAPGAREQRLTASFHDGAVSRAGEQEQLGVRLKEVCL